MSLDVAARSVQGPVEPTSATALDFERDQRRIVRAETVGGIFLVLPAIAFLLVCFVMPVGHMLLSSVLVQKPGAQAGWPLTFVHYYHFFATALYRRVLIGTLKISFLTTLAAVLMGYPVAWLMVHGPALVARVMAAFVLAPLVVSVVVRTYGWQLILANGWNGILNEALRPFGLTAPVHLLNTEWAVVIGSLHVYLPMMVLPLASSLARIPVSLPEAARTLGAPVWQVFWRVVLPLSVPGLLVGTSLVFSLTASSYVTPAILGGTRGGMLGTLIEQQVLSTFDWPFASTIATVLVATVLAANLLFAYAVLRRRRQVKP